MKRFLIFIFTFFFIITINPENKDFSRWTFSPEVGFNKFDGDAVQDTRNVFVGTASSLSYGANLEYALTPIWGISVNFLNIPFNGIYTTNVDTFSTKLINGNISATVNFSRMIFPQTNAKLYINGSIGFGYAYYTYNVKLTPNTNPKTALTPPYGNAGSIPISLSVEYNISKSISLGAKATYITFTKDNLEGVNQFQGVTNDRIALGTMFLSYKFGANNKDHLRNIRMNEFSPDEGLSLARTNAEKINKLDKELKKLDKKVDNQGKRIDSIAQFLSNDGPDSDGDGVPDVRDKEPNTPPNTPVDFWGKTLKINSNNFSEDDNSGVADRQNKSNKSNNKSKSNSNSGSNSNSNSNNCNCDDTPAVYFDFDRIDLDDNALIMISKMAKKMKDDPSLYVEVRGYCDYIGKNPYNETLSKRRAERVKTEMVKIWKIPANHIIANGKGKIIEPRIKYKPNRRCDFFFDKQ